MDKPHYTDKHLVSRGSSIDIVERCMAFVRQSGDFEGILDYAENEVHPSRFQKLLRQLTDEAQRIAKVEMGGR